MSLNAKDLVILIKKLIKEEVQKTVREALREEVSNEVNSILAEKFLATLGRTSISEVVERAPEKKSNTAPKKQLAENRKKELLRKMGVEENPMMGMIYSDIDSVPSQPIVIAGQAIPVDSDDEGIDLGQFGLGD